ncbi:MAG: MFS transporter [Aigarchaeota archaeon]|nr:MFS transporter [Aigarchaeota archaeon]
MDGEAIQKKGHILASTMAAFTAYALAASVFGPSLPAIVQDFALAPVQVGALAAAGSIGFLSVLPAGILADMLGKKKVVIAGIGVIAAGTVLAGLSSSFPLLLAALILAGVGNGFFEGSVNTFVSDVYKDKPGFALNALHSTWGVGGFLGPLLAGLMLSKFGLWQPNFVVAGSIVAATIIPMAATSARRPLSTGGHRRRRPTLRLNVSPALVLALFLVWGTELGINSFLPLFLQSERGFDSVTASASLSMLFVALALGRAVWSVTSDRLGLYSTAKITAAAAGVLILLAAVVPVQLAVIMLFMFAGFFFASVVPTILALAAREAGVSSGSTTGFILLIASVGGIMIPWSIALISGATNLFTGFVCLSILMASIAPLTHRAQHTQWAPVEEVPNRSYTRR